MAKIENDYFLEFLARHDLLDYAYGMGTVGPGWIPILDELVVELKKAGWDGHIAQIKEKFGTLRFYIGKGNDNLWNLIHDAEKKTAKVCEECGKPGTLGTRKGGYWLKTHCPECRKGEGDE